MARYHPVCPAAEIAPGEGRAVEIDGQAIAVFNVDGTLHAVENTCLHAGGPLHEGELKGTVVTCPWHQWEFDVATGRCHVNPYVQLKRYAVRVNEGVVEVEA